MAMRADVCDVGPLGLLSVVWWWYLLSVFMMVVDLFMIVLVSCMVMCWGVGEICLENRCRILGWFTRILSRVLVSDIACWNTRHGGHHCDWGLIVPGLCPLTVLRQQSRCVHLFDFVCVGWVDGVFFWVNP